MIRIAIADDHALLRAGLRRLLEEEKEYQVLIEAGNGKTLLLELGRKEVDLVIVDLSMPETNGFEVLRSINENWPAIRTIVLSMHGEDNFIRKAQHFGASGYVLKDEAFAKLHDAIRAVMKGETRYPRLSESEIPPGVKTGIADAGLVAEVLSDRECEVLLGVARGKTSRMIAAELGISPRTVETHRANLMARAGAETAADLVRFAVLAERQINERFRQKK